MYLHHALTDGSLWFLLACLLFLGGVVIGFFTDYGSGIYRHPYTKPSLGGELATDLPQESIGRAELEPLLWGHKRPAVRPVQPVNRTRRSHAGRAVGPRA